MLARGDEISLTPSDYTILLVEDSSINVKIVTHVLEKAGYESLVARDGETGLQIAQAQNPDLILLDVVMPGIDGYEVCRQLKSSEDTKDIPVVFMTGVTETANKVQAFELGAVDYVTKPIQPAELLARIHTHLTLHRLQLDLEEEVKERGHLISELDAYAHMVAHDLKGPLGNLIGFAEILETRRDRLSPEEFEEVLESITYSGYKLRNIIDSLLMLASVYKLRNIIDSLLMLASVRQQEVDLEPISMAKIVSDCLRDLQVQIQRAQATIETAESWPIVCGYAPWIEEVWRNYLSNGLKYGGNPPHLRLGFTRLDNGWVRFWVKDDGPGLTGAEQAQLFQPFTRLHQVKVEGHGLGLSVVRRILNKLGGKAGVDSQPGVGSTFYFTLPLCDDDENNGDAD